MRESDPTATSVAEVFLINVTSGFRDTKFTVLHRLSFQCLLTSNAFPPKNWSEEIDLALPNFFCASSVKVEIKQTLRRWESAMTYFTSQCVPEGKTLEDKMYVGKCHHAPMLCPLLEMRIAVLNQYTWRDGENTEDIFQY